MTQTQEKVTAFRTDERSLSTAIAEIDIHVPTRGNRKLDRLIENANADAQLKAWWVVADVNATKRLGMSDHGWVHIQVVSNIALRILRLLAKRGVEPSVFKDFGMDRRDAEVIVVAGAMLHDVGMSIHRADHEAYSLFLAADKLDHLLDGIYDEPERSVIAAEIQHAIIGHRRNGTPLTIEAGVVRVADALDMAAGRSRVPFEAGQKNIHALSAAAIDGVSISAGAVKPVRIEITMNNSAGIFQIDELLGNKLKGSGIERYVEVAARVDREHEARLLPDVTF
ncbi:MAG: HD domain-containing protein [Solirubrobacterales bacterium]|nr:HD domain-containing protein [Solirubrobacterales bacterium]